MVAPLGRSAGWRWSGFGPTHCSPLRSGRCLLGRDTRRLRMAVLERLLLPPGLVISIDINKSIYINYNDLEVLDFYI